MCGIAGSIGYYDASVEAAVRKAGRCMSHRGPDAEGFWSDDFDAGLGVALAFRRLAIIDLSPEANQPMVDQDSGCVLCLNGEIYNYLEIRETLREKGVKFLTNSDSEVLLKAYAFWGESCLERLRGMFALAIWNPRTKSILLARDRLGIKPMYYAWSDGRRNQGTFYFASETRALLASGCVSPSIDPVGLATYLWNGVVFGPSTIVRDISLLPSATYMTVQLDGSSTTPQEYWTMPHERPSTTSAQQVHEAFEQRLDEAVRLRLISDVPLGVFLSGGIDSSAIAAIAMKHADEPIRTFNIRFQEKAYDESAHAQTVADSLGTIHETITLTEEQITAQMDEALTCLDQPSVDAINTYFISRSVREAGLTVALAGTGGDELLGGYRSFRDVPRAQRMLRNTRMIPESFMRIAARFITRMKYPTFGELPPQVRWGKLEDMIGSHGDIVNLYQVAYGMYTRSVHRSLMAPHVEAQVVNGLTSEKRSKLDEMIKGETTLSAVSRLEIACYLGERLLRDTDSASMAVSLEVRVPLIDHELFGPLAEMSAAQRFQPLGSKRILVKTALKGLEPSLFTRPKSGFLLPMEVWMRGRLRPMLESLFADEELMKQVGINAEPVGKLWRDFLDGRPGMYWTRVWLIAVLLWWCRRYDMRL